jgi:hypothetical protein
MDNRGSRCALAATILLGVTSFFYFFGRPVPVERVHIDAPDDIYADMLFYRPGIRQPQTVPSSTGLIDDDDEVIGISVRGRHRAYSVSTMADFKRHVVNDLIAHVPVTVTYCGRTRCARALTGDEGSDEPLTVVGRGWFDGHMMIGLAGSTYAQDAESIPGLTDMKFEKTTWKEWKTAHPDTDIYVESSEASGGAAD